MPKIIWTNHALDRLKDRNVARSQVIQAISSPDSKINNPDGSIELAREFGNQKAHAIIKENDLGEYIVLSCWINPPNYGSADYKKRSFDKKLKKASGIKKFWLTLLNQIGP